MCCEHDVFLLLIFKLKPNRDCQCPFFKKIWIQYFLSSAWIFFWKKIIRAKTTESPRPDLPSWRGYPIIIWKSPNPGGPGPVHHPLFRCYAAGRSSSPLPTISPQPHPLLRCPSPLLHPSHLRARHRTPRGSKQWLPPPRARSSPAKVGNRIDLVRSIIFFCAHLWHWWYCASAGCCQQSGFIWSGVGGD